MLIWEPGNFLAPILLSLLAQRCAENKVWKRKTAKAQNQPQKMRTVPAVRYIIPMFFRDAVLALSLL